MSNWHDVPVMLGERRRGWANIEQTVCQSMSRVFWVAKEENNLKLFDQDTSAYFEFFALLQ